MVLLLNSAVCVPKSTVLMSFSPVPVDHLCHPMAATFNVNAEAGLKKLDGYLLSRSYISGYVFHAIFVY